MRHYLHSVPGRLRVRIPAVKGNPERAEAIQKMLQAIEGVSSVSAQLLTGSIVVTYDPARLGSKRILDALIQGGHIDAGKLMSMDDYFTAGAAKAHKAISRALFGAAVEQALAGSQLAFLAILL